MTKHTIFKQNHKKRKHELNELKVYISKEQVLYVKKTKLRDLVVVGVAFYEATMDREKYEENDLNH